MINYPFVYPSAKENAPDVFKQIDATIYPAVDEDKPSRPPLGGINLGVCAFSDNKDLAFEAIKCLVQPDNQITAATLGGLPPTNEDVYETKDIEKAYPGFSDLIKESIDNAAPRPVTPAYTDLSLAIQRALHPSGDIDPADVTDHLRRAGRLGRAGRQAGGPAVMARGGAIKTSDRTQVRAQARLDAVRAGGRRDAAGDRVPDRLRAGALAAGDRPALPRRGRLRRPRQLRGGADLEPVVAGRLQHAVRDRDLGRDRADAGDDHRPGHVPGDLRARAWCAPPS